MRAVQVTSMGEPEVMELAEVADPEPAAGEVLIAVEAVGVGPWDTRMRAGAFGPQPTPYVPGAELAGTVVGVGGEVSAFAVGDRVWAHPGLTGAMAELVSLQAGAVGHAPAKLSFVEAATVPVGGLTASQALEQLDVQPGEVILVLAAGGNVGSFAVQLAHSRGAVVIAQAGAADADRLKDLGAEVVVDRRLDWVDQVRQAAEGGVAAVLDPLGADVLTAALPLVSSGGRVVTLAPRAADSDDPSGVTITALFVHPDGPALSALATAIDAGGLRTRLGQTFPIDQVAQAHRAYEQGAAGKVVVVVR